MKTLALEQAIIKRLLEQEQEEPVSIQPNSTIYVDMDGVVVDFHTPMIGEINSILDSGLPDFLQGSKTSRRALRKIKQQMGEEYRVGTKADLHNPLIRDLTFSIIKRKPYDYFVNLGQMKDGVEMLWPYVTSLPYRIEMLTASVQSLDPDPDKKTAEDAKKDWVATHLDPQPAAVNVVMGAARKIPYATSNGVPNVLIDDRSDTIAKWNEAGGIGILHTTGNSASTARRLKDVVSQVQEAAKRKPRKKGQKRKSSKHSDLYTDEDPKGTIHGLGFKDAATARKGRAIINKARRKHAHKVQAALVMKQRAKVAKERTKDPEKKKNLNAAYKVWSEYLEKLKAKTKKMKKNEASTLSEGAFDNLDIYLDLLNPLEVVKTATEYYAGLAGEASVDPQAAKKRFQKDLKSSGVQDMLGFLEYIPYVGVAPGIVNAGMYALQGNKERAMFSLLAAAGAGLSGIGVAKGLKTKGGQKLVVELDLMVKKFKGAIQGQPFVIAMKPSLEAVENLLKAGAAVLTPILAYSEDAIGEGIEDAKKKNDDLRAEAQKAADKKKEFDSKMSAYESGTSHPDFPHASVDPDDITEAVIKRLLSEQPYKTPGQEYIALFLDGPSRDKLTDILDDPPPGWTLHADHMTVKFGSEGVPASYLGPATIRVVGVALNDRVMTAKVETDVPTKNNIPHITIATAPGVKPRESNDFSDSDFEEVQTFELTGEVKPKFSDTLQKKMPKI